MKSSSPASSRTGVCSSNVSSPPDRPPPRASGTTRNGDEWVVLLQGEAILACEDGPTLNLRAGDHLLIPARKRHRVEHTSADPPCIWIAVHGKLT